MRLRAAFPVMLALAGSPVQAQTYTQWRLSGGGDLTAFVLACPTGSNREAVACGGPGSPLNVMAMPFVRATQSPFIFPFTTTPAQFLITQPVGANTYRTFNPCIHAHVRITSVKALEPVVTEPTIYPGVLRVTSRTETIDRFTGTRFGAGAETLGSASNPMGGMARIVSGIIVPIIGYAADLSNVTCEFELGYGNSG